jgi:hypothetical protein
MSLKNHEVILTRVMTPWRNVRRCFVQFADVFYNRAHEVAAIFQCNIFWVNAMLLNYTFNKLIKFAFLKNYVHEKTSSASAMSLPPQNIEH